MYVLDSVKDALFVYDFETGELVAEYPFDKLNKSPRGIWSDGVTIWVSDDGAKRLFAYRIEDGALVRHEDEEFSFRSLLKAGNGDARGIWSDGEVVYVADEQDDRLYSYNLPDAIDARLASLSFSDVDLGEFSPGSLTYTAVAKTGATVTTVAAIATQEAATVVIAPADADGNAENGHQVALQRRDRDHHHRDLERRLSSQVLSSPCRAAALLDRADRGATQRGHVRRRQPRRPQPLRPRTGRSRLLLLDRGLLAALRPRRARIPQPPVPQPLQQRRASRRPADRINYGSTPD